MGVPFCGLSWGNELCMQEHRMLQDLPGAHTVPLPQGECGEQGSALIFLPGVML